MIQKEIKSDNEIIAEFMGGYKYDDGTWRLPGQAGHCKESDLTIYYISWDRLMPVWVKFKNDCWSSVGYDTEFLGFSDDFLVQVFNGDCPKACEVMVKAIKWYKTQKP